MRAPTFPTNRDGDRISGWDDPLNPDRHTPRNGGCRNGESTKVEDAVARTRIRRRFTVLGVVIAGIVAGITVGIILIQLLIVN